MEETRNWKEQAEALFFVEHLSIQDIANRVKKNRRYVSKALKESEKYSYEEERERRKRQTAESRKEYKRDWDRANRQNLSYKVTAETMRREHDIAAAILSHEKYY